MNGISGARPILVRKNSSCASEFWSCNLASHGAGRDSDLRIIADAFVFSGVTSRHHVQLAILFSKPDRRAHNRAVLLKGTERNVLLTMNLVWDRHEKHCTQTNTASWKLPAAGKAPFTKATVRAHI